MLRSFHRHTHILLPPPTPKRSISLYGKRVIDHFTNPRNTGKLDKTDQNVGTGIVGAPACGDVMQFQIAVNPRTNRIIDAKFKTFGCGSAIASSSIATEWVIGRDINEVAGLVTNTEIAKYLNLPPIKMHCSMLAEDGIRAAITNYIQKQTNKS